MANTAPTSLTDLLIVGRGPSVYEYDSWGDMPVMAVSSGIYAVPVGVEVQHFVTMDLMKYFVKGLVQSVHCWDQDKKASHRAFWSDPHITKHVLTSRLAPGFYRELPVEVWDVIPEQAAGAFQRALTENIHQFGYQPSWGDCPNVHGWDVFQTEEPNIGTNGRTSLGVDGVCNSWLMAVQVASQLGFRRLHFVGCDMHAPHYKKTLEAAKRWYPRFRDAGIDWINLSPDSALAEFIPTEVPV